MRILQLTPGSGDNFYCENCLRDAAAIKALRGLGHDAVVVPLYLPPQLEDTNPGGMDKIFFGGINVYLQQKTSLFRKTPRWIDRFFDSPKLLQWIARKAHMTNAIDLAETTLSMLRGENGRQVKELNRLISWLQSQNKPDVFCLSNVLLSGLARQIKEQTQVPIVCLLQDEDEFIDALPEPYRQTTWDTLRRLIPDIDQFVAVSKYYADIMQNRLSIPPDRMHVVYNGIDGSGYKPAQPTKPTIGYLSRMCPDKGLDILADAFIILKQKEIHRDLKLCIAGGKTAADQPFVEVILKKLRESKTIKDVEFLTDFNRNVRLDFLSSLSVLSVPERRPPACGLYILEAWAAGVPVVQPRHGVFPELIESGGGGILTSANDAQTLAASLESILQDKDYAGKLGDRGRQAIMNKFNINQTAIELLEVYQQSIPTGHENSWQGPM